MWQQLQEDLGEDNITVIGVAMDVQGVAVARPWYEKQKLSYPSPSQVVRGDRTSTRFTPGLQATCVWPALPV